MDDQISQIRGFAPAAGGLLGEAPAILTETCRPQVAILTDEITRGYCRSLLTDVASNFVVTF